MAKTKKQEVNLFENMTIGQSQEIAVAIVRQAVDDYREALKVLYRMPNKSELKNVKTRYNNCYKATNRINECEDFFRSNWYQTLCSIAGEDILEKIQADILEDANAIKVGIDSALDMFKNEMEQRAKKEQEKAEKI